MRSAIRNLLYAAIFALSLSTAATYGDGPSGAIRFAASQEGVPLQGTFNEFAATVNFDPAKPETGTVRVRVDVGSVTTGIPAADEMLRGHDFFDAAKFPQATFEASEFHVQGAGHFIANGAFTLKGHKIPLPVTFTTSSDPRGQWFDGSFTLSRLMFGVGQGEWADPSTLDDAVKVQFHILQQKASH